MVGVVTSDDNLGSVRYLQDATAGIAIYPGMDWSGWDQTPIIGDSLSVTGAITEYNGLLEVGPELDAVEFLGTVPVQDSRLSPPPKWMSLSKANSSKSMESRFHWLAHSSLATTPTISLPVANLGSFTFGRAMSLLGHELTGCEVDMIGIVSQFSFDGTGGYQLLPRGSVDLIPASDLCFTSPVIQTNLETSGFTLSWTTDLACDGSVEYGLTEDLGSEAAAVQTNTPNHFVNLDGLEPGTIYYARAVCTTADGTTVSSSIRPYATVSESSGDIHVYFNGAVDHSVATAG